MNPIIRIFLLLVILTPQITYARKIYYGSSKETVTLAYGGPTVFRFDEEVKTISQASRFKIETSDAENPDYKMLSITPRFTKGSNNISFILSNGAVVQTRLVVVPKSLPDKIDSFYDFIPKDHLIEKSVRNHEADNVSEMELMKAMIRFDQIVGYKVKSVTRTVNTGIKGLNAKLVKVYSGPKYNGYIFKLRNKKSKKSYAIDLRALSLGRPNLALLSQVDNKILKAKGKGKNVTFLRIVAKPTSVYYSVKLPIAPIKIK
jgi:hypothetical protein